jgi:transcription antitermination factor NusG
VWKSNFPSEKSEALFKFTELSSIMSHCDSNYQTPAKNWFAVFTVPRHEKRVEEHLRVREIESFLPLCATQRRWKDGAQRTLQLPLFSSYLFVRIGAGGRVPVLSVPGVISIVGSIRGALSVPDSYIHFLREGLRLRKIEPYSYLTAGTRVRVRSGPMAGMEGVLLRKRNNYRVVLTLEMIMKSVTVEVEINDIEPAGETADTSLL